MAGEDHVFLKEVSRSRSMPKSSVERARMLLCYFEGKTVSETARLVGVNRRTVERIINKALEFGVVAALDDLHRSGRRHVISDDARTWIVGLRCSKPKGLGLAGEVWTNRDLATYIRSHCGENGFPELSRLSIGTISKIMKSCEVRPDKIEYYCEKRDPDFDGKTAIVLHTYKLVETLRALRESGDYVYTAVVSFDERPGICAQGTTSQDLMPVPDKYATIKRDYEYVRYGMVTLLAGIDLTTGHLHALVREKHTSKEFVEFLRQLDDNYLPHYQIIVILDNLKVHTSKETRAYLATVPNRFHFVFTPKHASWLNIIETFFSKMTRSFLRGISVDSHQELIDRIYRYIDEINQMPIVFKWKYKMNEIKSCIGQELY